MAGASTASPLTFGVELEFNIAFLGPDDATPDDANPDHTLRFIHKDCTLKNMREALESDGFESDELFEEQLGEYAYHDTIRLDIAERLEKMNLSATSERVYEGGHNPKWQVFRDSSVGVELDDDDGIDGWKGVELVSPRYDFTPANIQIVKDVCDLIARDYKYRVNYTTGLHVHVGDGDRGFSLDTMKRLVRFLWAFEPQFNTIHPTRRVDAVYAASMRNHSIIAEEFYQDHGYKIPAIQALQKLSQYRTIRELCYAACQDESQASERNMYYNLTPLAESIIGAGGPHTRPTIEFRQHEGTLDSARVTTWIKTVVGIVDAVRKMDHLRLQNLICICGKEKWQKHGDGKDSEREARLGPIVAESTFTVVDLLQRLGLNEEAAFYQARGLYDHTYPASSEPNTSVSYIDENGTVKTCSTRDAPPYYAIWDFEKVEANFPTNALICSEAYIRASEKKELWERTVVSNNLNTFLNKDYVPLDTTSAFWPKHTLLKRCATPPPPSPPPPPSRPTSSEDNGPLTSSSSSPSGSGGSGRSALSHGSAGSAGSGVDPHTQSPYGGRRHSHPGTGTKRKREDYSPEIEDSDGAESIGI